MRHVEKALIAFQKYHEEKNEGKSTKFINIENSLDEKGVAPVVSFTIQSDPISEVGVNGVQAEDMLRYVRELFVSLNNSFPCEENVETILHIDAALFHQAERTANRIKRGVEGKNQE